MILVGHQDNKPFVLSGDFFVLLICYPDLTTDSKDSVEFDDVQEAIGFNEGKLRFVGSFGDGLFGIKHLDTR